MEINITATIVSLSFFSKRVFLNNFFIILLIFSNCLTLTYVDRPKEAAEISEKDFSKNKNDFTRSNELNILRSEAKISSKIPIWGIVGLFNLCLLIPCLEQTENEIEITYSYKGKKLEIEKIIGHSYIVTSAVLIPYSIIFQNDDKKVKEKFEAKIEPYIQSKLFEFEKNRKNLEESYIKEQLEKEKEEIELYSKPRHWMTCISGGYSEVPPSIVQSMLESSFKPKAFDSENECADYVWRINQAGNHFGIQCKCKYVKLNR